MWIEKLQEEAEIPEVVYQKAEQSFKKIRMKQKGKKGYRSGRKKAAAIILAAVLTASTLTVAAATYFHWNDMFIEEYEVSPEIEKKLSESGAAKEMEQYTEHDGVRIEAVQCVADKNVAHIVLKVYGSDEFPLNDHMGFRDFNAQIDGGKQAFFYAGFMERPEDGMDDWSAGKEYEITLLNEGEGDFYKKEVRLIFSDIVDWYEGKLANTESPVLLESVWELTLLIDNEDSGREYEVDRQIPGSTAVVKRIYLSSVSCIVDYDWEYQTKTETCIDENGVEGTFEHTISPPDLTGVVYEDGSVQELVTSPVNGQFTNEERTEYQTLGVNSKLIEYENVRELIFSSENGAVRIVLK